MATNYVQRGKVLTLTAPYARSAGEGALIDSVFGVALNDVLIAVATEFAVTGVWTLAKTAAQAWTVGEKIYWDDGNKRCDTTSSVGPLIGVATAIAANPSSTGVVRLDGASHQLGALGGSIIPSATVAATGTVQADAALIATGFTLVTAADATKGVKLPAAAAGKVCIIKNIDAANAVLKVWPNTDDAINAIAANAAMSIAAKTSAIFVAYDATTWYTTPLLPS